MSIMRPGRPTVPRKRSEEHIWGSSLVIKSMWHMRIGSKSLLLRRIWYGRIFRYFSFHVAYCLLAKNFNLVTIKPNFLFVGLNLISLKHLMLGQKRKYFRLWGSGGDSLSLIWQQNGHLQSTRTVLMTLYAKNTALTRRNGPNFVKAVETLRGRYLLCDFHCFQL